MKRRNKGFTTYQQTLFNKYEIDESYLQTRKQRRACLELLEKIDRDQHIDDKKTIEKIASAFQGSELYKKVASCMTIAALLVALQGTPVMAQAATGFQSSVRITDTLLERDNSGNSIIMDEDSFLYDKGHAVRQEVKNTSLHLVAGKSMQNAYEPLTDNGVIIDGDSDVTYYSKQEVKTLTVIDTDIQDWETLRDAVKEGEILLLGGTEDPLEAILARLQDMKEVDCLNIISHGSGGRLEFANGVIDSQTLATHKDNWAQLSGYFSPDGDMQLFGCNIAQGEAGKAFIEELAQITGADVAASINPTGAESKGGDWKLEAIAGDVAGNLPFTEKAIAKFLNLLEFPTGLQDYTFSDFTDDGDTLSNNYFEVSGTDAGEGKPMEISGSDAFLNNAFVYSNFSITVEAVGTSLESFELEDLYLSNTVGDYDVYDVQIIGHKADGTGTVNSGDVKINIDPYGTISGGSFAGWNNFDGVPLDYFVINAKASYWGAEVLMFNSFSVSNMVPAAPPNTAPTVSDSTKDGTEDTTMTFAEGDFSVGYSDAEGDPFSGIKIVSLPNAAHGVLKLDGVAIASGQEIDAADIEDITFEPAADFFGNTSFTWKASDGTAFSDSAATMTLDIEGVNDAPTAANHTYTTNEDTVLNESLAGDAEDVDGDPLTYAKVSDPSHGTITVNLNGSFTYTPEANYNGTDSFDWSVSDGKAAPVTATATITVNAVNDVPTVSNNSKNGTEDTTMAFTAGDFSVGYSDVEGSSFSGIKIVSLPNAAHGTLKLSGADIVLNQEIAAADIVNITFEPAANFNGNTSFTWQAGDGSAYSATATMTLSLDAVNDSPTAANNTYSTDEDTALNGNLSGDAEDVDGDTLTYSKVSDPSHGTVTVNANGTFTYTPAANFNGTDSFTWSVSDGTADSNIATATITVNAINDAPTVSNNSKNGTEDTTMTFAAEDFSVGYSDVESDVFSGIRIATLPDAAHGVLKLGAANITANQIIAAADLGNITFEPVANFNGSTSFTWEASDVAAYSAVATMTLNIAGVNDAPTAADHTFTTDEDVVLNDNLTDYAADVDTGDTLIYTKESDPAHGTFTINTNGSFTYTPAANYNGTDSFTWSVSDGTADSNIATATITINAVNDAPTVSNNIKNGTEDTTVTFASGDFSVGYSDVESDAFSGIQIVTLPDSAHGVLKLDSADITVGQEIDAAALGNITFVPAANFNGTTSFTWKAGDGTDFSESAATMTLNIAGVNDAPTAADNNTYSTDEDTVLNGNLSGDAEDVDGDILTYAKVSDPSHGTVAVNADGSFTYTPEANFSGTDSFDWSVSDGTVSATATATISVNAVNDAPTVANSIKNGTEDMVMTFTADDFNRNGVYADEEDEALSSVWIVSLPDSAHGTLKLNGADITAGQEIAAADLDNITFVPAADFAGDAVFTWKASDGTSYSASAATMTLSMAGVYDAPGAPTNVTASAGDRQVTVTFISPADDGGSAITKYIVTSEPGGITAEGGTSPITVTGLTNGTIYTFKVKAVNGVGTGPESTSSNEVTPYSNSSSDSDSDSSRPSSPPTMPASPSAGVNILINGKTETAATSTTTQEGGRTVSTITVDGSKVEQKLEAEGSHAVITIPVSNSPDVVVGQLNGQTVKSMETKEAVLEINTDNVTYSLPASQIDISRVSEQFGNQVELEKITVSVTVAEPPQDTVKVIEDTADRNNYQIVVQPVQFEITCTYAGKTVEVSKFNAYVERLIAIPEGVDPNRITTGIILNPDGTFSHVPTQIIIVDGKYYAKINSLTNSAYSVIWSPRTFKDVDKHWAKEVVNDMGSRLIISDTGNENFTPDSHITRAEFAAILVRGLGLMRPDTGKDTFKDVSANDGYYNAVSIAYEYGLIYGLDNEMFGPSDLITREQAMVMVERAMKLTGLKADLTNVEVNDILQDFKDGGQSSGWARKSVAACIKTDIIAGKTGGTIEPKEQITRAEAAVIVQRLLQKSGLI